MNEIKFNEGVYDTVKKAMLSVTEDGTGAAVFDSYAIKLGGKSGTSQNPQGEDHTIFVAFAPFDNPEIAVLVMLDEPKGSNYYGGVISAPVNGKIMADVLPYLGYEPSYTEEEIKKAEQERIAKENGLLYEGIIESIKKGRP
mgnify:CR=1 FL=1